ncbi:MAG: transporter substrate-binding domain-containing protein [Candidatus Borkfalkiaceae bacterium]|nr:transporter substrate-binding domain-containing protein [Christensenellaceae bacterium]
MKRLLTAIIASLMALTAMFSFTACGDNNETDNTIKVGMECGYAPFNYTQTTDANGAVKISNAEGYANGYDVQIAVKIAEALGKELVIVKYEWDALINAVQTGALDFIIAGMSPTAERLESIDFSSAYYESQLVIVVRKDGNFANATKLSDFNGAKIAAQIGTFHDQALEAQAQANGIIRQTPMDTFPALINALNTGAIDGYVAEEPGAKSDCATNSAFTYIPLVNNDTGFTATAEDVQIAIGLKKGSQYKDPINTALASIDAATRLAMMETATANAPTE